MLSESTPNSEEREALADVLMAHPWLAAGWPKGFCPTCHVVIDAGHNSPLYALHLADAVLAAGYRPQDEVKGQAFEEAIKLLEADGYFCPAIEQRAAEYREGKQS